ncbi:hypothetical protein B7P43_G15807 [Cryptotermes secundus]|uniref:RNA-directed DNA polymerase n=1 Tax=Cryptotermes secundus TaxID=105785 RepID=A0A2J7RJ63_9NEOP|nr:hypothetical protein B7P43_G15807 [Cryptotermes secundus]
MEGQVKRSEVKSEQELDVFCRKVKEGLSQRKDYMVLPIPEGTPRLVIPETMVGRLIRDHHDAKHAAHAGVKKLQHWMCKKYYWSNLHRDVEDYVLSCDQRARLKAGRVTTAPMGNLPEARGPREVVSIDITRPYATSRRGNRYLLTYIDHFTKRAEAVPLPDQEAMTVASAPAMQIFRRHGVCDKLLSDQGRNFTSDLIREICRLLGVDKIFTSPYRP